ncbi:MAG: CU044_2847 family protein [Candidatus Electrothrix communis]|nr:MAG: CU044_2847 family protein [Candidatus Electrothrix communis]
MCEIKEIKLADGTSIFVEMETVDFSPASENAVQRNLPPGAEEVNAVETVLDTMKTLKGTLSSVFNTVQDAVKDKSPDEWGVELNIGFKGKVNPIPVIVSGESSVAIKVHAHWKKKQG